MALTIVVVMFVLFWTGQHQKKMTEGAGFQYCMESMARPLLYQATSICREKKAPCAGDPHCVCRVLVLVENGRV